MNRHGILSQQRFQAAAIPQGGGLKYVQCRQVGEQVIPDQGLLVINAPQKSRDALGVSANNKRWIFLRSGGDFRRLPTPDEVKKTLAHRTRLASPAGSPAEAAKIVSFESFVTEPGLVRLE